MSFLVSVCVLKCAPCYVYYWVDIIIMLGYATATLSCRLLYYHACYYTIC
jgi:hypothetical protein